jgi:hypothetical protein
MVAAGCSSPGSSNVTAQKTTAPVPTVTNEVTTVLTPTVTTQVTPANNMTIPMTTVPTTNQTTPEAMPSYSTDVSNIVFTHYTDSDFSAEYPSDWNVSKSSYTAYYCMNDESPMAPGYSSNNFSNWCYQNDTQAIGPFDFYTTYSDAFFQKTSRVVTFTSPDTKLKFSSYTSDFVPNMVGNMVLNPTEDWCKAQFELEYPDLSSSLYVSNYQYTQKPGGLMIATYDVTMPAGSKYYPLTYTKEVSVSLHHEYEFAFIDSNENPDSYSNLDNYIISSITVNDAA